MNRNVLIAPGEYVTISAVNPKPSAVVNDGAVPSEGTGTLGLDNYHVFLFDNGQGACQCQDYFYRAVVGGGSKICKHIEALKG